MGRRLAQASGTRLIRVRRRNGKSVARTGGSTPPSPHQIFPRGQNRAPATGALPRLHEPSGRLSTLFRYSFFADLTARLERNDEGHDLIPGDHDHERGPTPAGNRSCRHANAVR